MAKVLCGGVFNLLHPGHLFFLEKAKELGDELIVVVASEEHVAEEKRSNLIFSAEERAHLVRALGIVDKVVIGKSGDITKVVKELEPDVIALGYDQDFDEEKLSQTGAKVVRIREKLEPEKHKSSKIIEKIRGGKNAD